jgi:transposase, IS6 family
MHSPTPFKWRHFQAEIILLCVRWYLRYPLNYRDLEEMVLERGLHIDHTTIYRWVQHYAPELEKRCRPHLKATNDSWHYETMNILRKGQIRSVEKKDSMKQVAFIASLFGVAV